MLSAARPTSGRHPRGDPQRRASPSARALAGRVPPNPGWFHGTRTRLRLSLAANFRPRDSRLRFASTQRPDGFLESKCPGWAKVRYSSGSRPGPPGEAGRAWRALGEHFGRGSGVNASGTQKGRLWPRTLPPPAPAGTDAPPGEPPPDPAPTPDT